MWPKVIAIVLNWNGKDNTFECLKSLKSVEYPNYEIIVVDNASTDGSQKFLREKFPDITIIENKRNLGFGGGFNVGIREAIKRNADYVLCLSNDVVLDKKILTELVKIGELSDSIGVLCAMEYAYDEPDRIICAGGTIGKIGLVGGRMFGYGEKDIGQFNEVRETGMLSGPAMMLKVNALLDIGFFDTSYFYGPEDKDMALRLMKKRYKIIFVPTAKFWHKRRGSVGGKFTPLSVFFEVRNSLLYVRKNLMNLNKFEQFLSFLYLGLIDFPIILFKCFLSSKKIRTLYECCN